MQGQSRGNVADEMQMLGRFLKSGVPYVSGPAEGTDRVDLDRTVPIDTAYQRTYKPNDTRSGRDRRAERKLARSAKRMYARTYVITERQMFLMVATVCIAVIALSVLLTKLALFLSSQSIFFVG